MKEIKLTRSQVTHVSDDQFESLSLNKWCALQSSVPGKFYAARRGYDANGKVVTILMHRQILGLGIGDERKGDHVNGDTLNNTNENIRIATSAQNTQNAGKRVNNTSGYKGVSRWGRQWMAEITVNYVRTRLGTRSTPEAAHRELYVPAALKFHGEFARLD